MNNDLNNGMTKLFAGLTSSPKPENSESQPIEPSTTGQQTQRRSIKRERLCATIDSDILNKVRSLSQIEGVSIRDIISFGLKMILDKYEETHGKIRVKRPRKGDIATILEKE